MAEVKKDHETSENVRPSSLGVWLRHRWHWGWREVQSRLYEGKAYHLTVPQGNRIFTPWFDTNSQSDFVQDLAAVRQAGHLLVSPDRCYMLYQLARSAMALPGALAECGVFTGGTANLLALAIEREGAKRDLHLFDSFVGMPETSEAERDYHIPGEFSNTSEGAVRARLRSFPNAKFHVGFIPGTLSEVADVDPYCFVHVDVDIYDSAKDCCEWFWPRMATGGIMAFDDYGFYPYRKAIRVAMEEFFADKQEPIIALPTGQGLVIKR